MVYQEVVGDLFSEDNNKDAYFVHCISADFALGKGIAVEFVHRYDVRYKLQTRYPNYLDTFQRHRIGGDCLLVDRVFNLITKEHYWEKPTIITMRLALLKLKELCLQNDVKIIVMPKIGSGLDRLPWKMVSEQIKNIFNDTNINITVYSL